MKPILCKGSKQALQRIDVELRRLESEYRAKLWAGVRVERRVIHGQTVDVKVCPIAEPVETISQQLDTPISQRVGDGCSHISGRRSRG